MLAAVLVFCSRSCMIAAVVIDVGGGGGGGGGSGGAGGGGCHFLLIHVVATSLDALSPKS